MQHRDLANCTDSAVTQIVRIGAETKKDRISKIIPEELLRLHQACRIHIHDMEFYESAYNCLGVNPTELMNDNPRNFSAACRSLFRGIIALTNQQSGGIGLIDFDEDMAKFVCVETDEKLEDELFELLLDLNSYVRKGSERAYVTLNFGLSTSLEGRRVIKALLKAFSKRQFVFPNLVWKIKSGINRFEKDPNYDLFLLSCSVTSQCMNPTYFNVDASFNSEANSKEIGIMGCRSRVIANQFWKSSSLNRGNVAAVTINLVQIAYESNGSRSCFEGLLMETMDNALHLLLHRYKQLEMLGDFHYVREHNLYLGANQGDVGEMLKNGTLSIGFIGLWDSLSVIHGVEEWDVAKLFSHFEEALEIVKKMRLLVDKYAKEKGLNISLLASSAEGVTGRFSEYDEIRYKNSTIVSKKGFYTNSFHIPVQTKLNCFEKIDLEAPFHELCNGGHITYVELSEIPFGNIEAISELVNYACDRDMGYFGINFPLDICEDCGRRGHYGTNCVCGSTKILRLRRVSGYLSDVETFTKGKSCELYRRSSHVSGSNGLDLCSS